MIKRSWLSIKRKRSKTVIMFIVMFIISNLVLAAIAIKNATDESMAYAKESIGGEVYLNPDMEQLRSNMGESLENIDPTERKEQMSKFERPTVYIDTVNDIKDSNYLSDYSYSISASAKASDIEVLETTTNDNNGGGFGGENKDSEDTGNIRIEAVNAYAFISGVEEKTMTLSSGEYFDEDSDNSVVISYELATLNSLSVGDNIKLSTIESEEVVELKIIGIYDTTEDSSANPMMGNSGNTVYMNIDTGIKFLSTEEYNDGNYAVNNVTFYLTNPNNLDAFLKEANAKVPTLADDNLKLDINTTAYDTMVGPIESVGSFASTILIIVVIAAVIIISLIINSQVKERNYEMGVLMSLGETKKKILGQIIIELVVISTFAFILSTGSSLFVAKGLSKSLLDNQLKMTEKQTENNFGREMNGGNKPGFKSSDVEVVDEINVSMNSYDYIKLFGIGYFIVIVSMVLPAINIMKYEPKTILSRRGA